MLLLHSHVFVPNSTSAKVRFVSSTLNTGQSLLKIVTDASKALSKKEQKGFFSSLSIAKDCLLTGQDKKRLALGSPGYFFVSLVVVMPKMAQYTGKWVLTSPKWSHPRSDPQLTLGLVYKHKCPNHMLPDTICALLRKREIPRSSTRAFILNIKKPKLYMKFGWLPGPSIHPSRPLLVGWLVYRFDSGS